MFFGETRGRCPCFLLCRNKQKSTDSAAAAEITDSAQTPQGSAHYSDSSPALLPAPSAAPVFPEILSYPSYLVTPFLPFIFHGSGCAVPAEKLLHFSPASALPEYRLHLPALLPSL